MKLLVVEDERRVADTVKKGLELQKATVDVAYDGETGLEFALSGSYDVIILDRMLPKKDGMEICTTIRREEIHTPVLMLTAKNQLDEKVEGFEAGVDDYLGKPFAFAELLARIKALSRRSKKLTGQRIQIDTLEIDTINFKITRKGELIRLSKKEYALLEYLARHQHQVISAEQIIERVWSYDTNVLSNTAQVYVGYLRKKIDKDFPQEKRLLHTIRGFGYTFGVK